MFALIVVSVVVGAGCWTTTGANPGRTYNPVEVSINRDNVSTLVTDWSAATTGGPILSDGATLFVASAYNFVATSTIYAYDLLGASGCGGSPKSCSPRWTATLPGSDYIVGATLGGDRLYVITDLGLSVFDASTKTGCSGTPKVCSALWRAIPDHSTVNVSDLAVVDGSVYLTTDRLYAYDAAGSAGCGGAPKVCTPRWTSPAGFSGTPSAWNGNVYVAPFGGGVAAFDGAGTVGCAGAPKVCAPRWTASVPVGAPIAVANGVAYVTRQDFVPSGPTATSLVAIDATGTTSCSGSPKVCAPLWTAPLGSSDAPIAPQVSPPSIENGTVFVAGPDAVVKAFDAAGQAGCSGVPKVCTPLWRTSQPGFGTASVVANGLLYAGTGVYDSKGSQSCSGAPKICHPIATVTSTPLIANGRAVFSTSGYVPGPHFEIRVDRLP